MSKSVGDGYGESVRRSKQRNLRRSLEVVKPAFLRPPELGEQAGLEQAGIEKRARLRSPEPVGRAKATSVMDDEDVATDTSSSHIDYDSAHGKQGEVALAGNTVAAFETASHDHPEIDELPVELYEHSTFELANIQRDKTPKQRFDLDEVADPETDLIAEGRRALPVWLVSMLIHLFVLMCLAVITFGGDRKSGIMLELVPAEEAIEFSFIEVQLPSETEAMEAEQDLAQSSVESELSGTFQVSEMWNEDSDSLFALNEEFGDVELGEQVDIGDPVVEPAGTSFFGLKSYGDQFVFVIDCSSSMTQNFRWERAVYELSKAIKGLDDEKEFLVLLGERQVKSYQKLM